MTLIKADQRARTASLMFKLAGALPVDLTLLSGRAEWQLETGLRESVQRPIPGRDSMQPDQIVALTALPPYAGQAMPAFWRTRRVADECQTGISTQAVTPPKHA